MILRHIEATDWPLVGSYPHFDGFVVHSGQHDPEVRYLALELCQTKKVVYLYEQVFTKPLPDWVGQGNPWFDYVAELPTLRTLDGREAIAWSHSRPIIAWNEMTRPQVEGAARVLLEWTRGLTPPSGGTPFAALDLAVRRPRPWMFLPSGPEFHEFPADFWPAWEKRFLCFLRTLDALKVGHFTNLDRTLPGPLYRELAQLTWEEDSSAWLQAQRKDVLSVLADEWDAVYRLVELARGHRDKWIAFTGNSGSAVDEAYAYAAEELGW